MIDINTPQRQKLADDYPAILNNIINDPHLTDGCKEVFFTNLDTLEIDGDIESHIRNYCRNLKLKGPVYQLDEEEILGRVHSLNALGSLIADSLGMSINAAIDLLDAILLDPGLADPLRVQLADVPISRGIVWSFQDGLPNNDPFEGHNLDDILCRLGVPREAPRYIRYGHRLPNDIQAHSPTAFDASTNQHWRPGGLTKPLEECTHIHEEGLTEVVHLPNTVNEIATEIQEL